MCIRKRWMAVILVILVLFIVAACNGAGSESGSDSDSVEANVDEQVTLKMWTWHPPPEVWESILQKFYEKYPNIHVEVSVYPSLDYQQKAPVALATGEDIDIIGIQATAFASQVEPYLEPMDELMKTYVGDDWESKFEPNAIEQIKKISDQNVVTAPVGSAGAMVIYYNMGLLQELGLPAPETYEDLKEIAGTVKAQRPDIIPMAVGGKEPWILDEIVLSLVGQRSDMFNEIRYGDGTFDTPEYVQAVKDFAQMFDDGVMTEDVMDLDYSRSLEVFVNGQAAMFVQGTWESYLLSEPARISRQIDLEDVGLIAFPAVTGNGTPSIRSFLDIGLGVTQSSRHKKEAMDFIRFMTLEEGADMLGDQFYVVPSKIGYKPKPDYLTTDEAMLSYERMVQLVANPSADRNNLSSLSDFIGSELQKLILTGQSVEETVKNIEAEFVTGKHE